MMKSLKDMTMDERSLLVYLETCAVDQGGLVDGRKMNTADTVIAIHWHNEKFIEFKRVCADDARELSHSGKQYTHAVSLSGDAWTMAHQERRERNTRMNKKRSWKTTDEKQIGKKQAPKKVKV